MEDEDLKDSQVEVGQEQDTTDVDQAKNTPKEEQKTFKYTEEQWNAEMGRTRKATEKATQEKILKQLGIDSPEKLKELKKAYDDSLTKEEKQTQEFKMLTKELEQAKEQLMEKDIVIAALSASAGVDVAKSKMMAKMAKGLVDDETTFEEAVKTVSELFNIGASEPKLKTKDLRQPHQPPTPEPNPFKEGEHYSMEAQAALVRENPEKARKLAKEAGNPNAIL